MAKIDLSLLVNADVAYDKAANAVAEKYNTAWDDAVHDSFRRFVSQIKENGRRLHGVRISAELVEKALAALNIEEANAQAQGLAKEAENL